jgi:DnaJ-class molecular chaperone
MDKTPAPPLPVSNPLPATVNTPVPSQVAPNVCPECGGRGLDATGATCATCKGSGEVLETVGDA